MFRLFKYFVVFIILISQVNAQDSNKSKTNKLALTPIARIDSDTFKIKYKLPNGNDSIAKSYTTSLKVIAPTKFDSIEKLLLQSDFIKLKIKFNELSKKNAVDKEEKTLSNAISDQFEDSLIVKKIKNKDSIYIFYQNSSYQIYSTEKNNLSNIYESLKKDWKTNIFQSFGIILLVIIFLIGIILGGLSVYFLQKNNSSNHEQNKEEPFLNQNQINITTTDTPINEPLFEKNLDLLLNAFGIEHLIKKKQKIKQNEIFIKIIQIHANTKNDLVNAQKNAKNVEQEKDDTIKQLKESIVNEKINSLKNENELKNVEIELNVKKTELTLAQNEITDIKKNNEENLEFGKRLMQNYFGALYDEIKTPGIAKDKAESILISHIFSIAFLSISYFKKQNNKYLDCDDFNYKLLLGIAKPIEGIQVNEHSSKMSVDEIAYYTYHLLKSHNIEGLGSVLYSGYKIGK